MNADDNSPLKIIMMNDLMEVENPSLDDGRDWAELEYPVTIGGAVTQIKWNEMDRSARNKIIDFRLFNKYLTMLDANLCAFDIGMGLTV